MKTLTKMFLLSCWCLISVSFAKETLEEIKANQEQQLIQEKLEILESQTQTEETKEPKEEPGSHNNVLLQEKGLKEIPVPTYDYNEGVSKETPIPHDDQLKQEKGLKEIPVPNYSNDGIDKDAILEAKEAYLNNKGTTLEPLSIEELNKIGQEIKEEILLKGYTVEEYIDAVNADRVSIEKEGAVSFETYLQGLDAKEQAIVLEYVLQSPSNNEGEVVNNPQVPHLKSLVRPGVRLDQDKVDYYNNLHQENDAAHGGSSIENWTDSQYTSELVREKADAFGTNVYINNSRAADHTFEVCSDYYASEGSWAVYSYADGGYITDTQYFSAGYECNSLTLNLEPGSYDVDSWDSYGDGGQDIYVDAEYVGSSSGSYSYITVELTDPEPTCSDVTLVVGGGSYDSEISWDLSDGSSGAAGTFTLCLEDGDYTFNGYDSWGDGWNGATATFTDADGAVIGSFAVEGSSGSWTVTVGGAPPVAGCTDANAPNYNADAEVDDGSCEAYCGDGSGCGTYLDYGYTCEELTGYGYDCSACEAEGACPVLGCTDEAADNYDSGANTDDGSCTYPCAGLFVNMVDSWGDGWNGNVLTIGDQSFTIDSGAAAQGCYTGATEDVAVTCGGGSYQGEVSWDISDADGNVLLSGGAPYEGVLNPSTPPVCEDEAACNNGAEGDCTYAETGYNCDGSCADGYENDCSGACASSSTIASWQGDGYCDDGAWGLYLNCCDFNMDDGDCDASMGCDGVAVDCGGAVNDDCGECGGDNSTCADCAGVANGDSFLDCADSCLAASYLGWIGDGYCDDGSWGADFVSCGDFNCDDGDCGTELIDGSCQSSGCSDSEFTCSNGDCIPAGYYCDGSSEWGNAGWGPDCADGSDELFDECCAAGAYADDLCNPPPTCSDIGLVVGGGSYDSEISWDLSDGSSGAAGTFALCLEDGDYTFNGYDSWGDGWNGASATFTDADGNVLASFAVEGSSGSWTLTIGGEPPVAGCTDPGAPNYNADASVDDGSCEAYCNANESGSCAYWLDTGLYTCEELVGYGYDCSVCEDAGACPVSGCTDETADNYNPDATINDGSCDYGACGGLTVTMCDSYGDGWNGNLLTIGEASFEPASGDPCEDACYTGATDNVTVSCDGGTWQSEISWSLSDADGNELLAGGAPYYGVLNPSGDVEGCTDPTADNYNPDATVDDGSCYTDTTCADCTYDWTAYGAECCDAAWDTFGINCAQLEANYNWDCSGCACPGDPTCEDEGLVTCDDGSCAATADDCGAGGDLVDCQGNDYTGYESWIGDGFCDDGSWGFYFNCDEFDCDAGDCETDCAGVCGGDAVVGCDGVCDSGLVNDECGVCDGDGSGCECSNYTLVVGGGAYDSEMGWSLDDGDGNLIATAGCDNPNAYGICEGGGNGTFDLCLYDGFYSFYGYDSWGDGWNGGYWEMFDADGNSAAGGPEYTITEANYYGWGWGWGLCLGACGCTYADAENYDPDATIEDWSCDLTPGTDCAGYWGAEYAGTFSGCGSVHCYSQDEIDADAGNGSCNAHDCGIGDPWCHGMACEEFYGCDGGDCSQMDDPYGECYVAADCGDGDCNGDEDYTTCPEDCDAPGECADGEANYTLVVGGGSYDSEMGWSLDDEDGNLLATAGCDNPNSYGICEGGGNGTFELCLSEGFYSFYGYDSWGDGWNGGYWEIFDADGNSAAGGPGYTITEANYYGWGWGWGFCLGACGCTYADAENYDPDATIEDWSCDLTPGTDCAGYWGDEYAGTFSGCGSVHCYSQDEIDADYGNGSCNAHDCGIGDPWCHGMACDEFFECDGGDCSQADDPYGECYVAPQECDDTACTLEMVDSYGDSWNGNVWTSGDQSATNDGSTGQDPQYADLCFDMDAANVYTCDGGSWQGEVSWTLTCGGDIVASGGAPAEGCFGNCDSVVYGCTDEAACNYNPDATDEDGTCDYGDCNGDCDGDAVVDDCGECGGDGTACADCAYPQWYADGYCDGSNNVAECGYDGGDCCPGDCVDATYECETYGGDCTECADPDSADNQEGGECYDMVVGCTDPDADNYNPDANTDDGSCIYDGCAAGTVPGCSEQDIADEECASSGWIGDGLCDGYSEAWGINFCCYDNDGGDCTDAECSAPEDWDATITGLTAEGVDYYGYSAVQWDWDDLSDGDDGPETCEDQGLVTCDDGSCAATAEDCPIDDGTCADGSDPLLDCIGTEFCDEDCANTTYDSCAGSEDTNGDGALTTWIGDGYCDDGSYGLEFACYEYDCDGCDCGSSYSSNGDGCNEGCTDPGDDSDSAECAATFTVVGSTDLDGDYVNDECYTDGSGYFVFDWEGGCLATSITYSGGELDLSAYGFVDGFFFYGFDPGSTEEFLLVFNADYDNGLAVATATSDCPVPETCEDNGLVTCPDGSCVEEGTECEEFTCADDQFMCASGDQCIPASYLCDGSNEFCNAGWGPDCADGSDEGLELCGYEDECEDDGGDDGADGCEWDATNYGAADCDAAWETYGLDCATLIANYGWDCTGCECPGDADDGDGGGSAEEDCAAAGGHYCGDDESNWTSYSPNGCVPDYYICDGWDDCVDASDEANCDGRSSSHANVLSTDNTTNLKYYSHAIDKYKRESAGDLKSANKTLVEEVEASIMINALTGEVTYSDSYNNANREVSYTINVSCDACLTGGPWSGAWEVATSDFLVYGFDTGSSVCGNVTGNSTLLGSTEASGDACDAAGAEDECPSGVYDCAGVCEGTSIVDCSGACVDLASWIGDGYCDDGSWGAYFNCAEFDCDAGDCSIECWDGSSACQGDTECPEEPTCVAGDTSGDGIVNVTDIVTTVNYILGGGTSADDLECGDMNADGLINVTDIVTVVNYILGGGTLGSNGATEAIIEIASDQLSVRGVDGTVDGVQLTLSHGFDFSIELVDVDQANAEIAAKRSIDNNTTIVIVAQKDLSFIGTTTGEYDIISYVVAATADNGLTGRELSTSSTSISDVVEFKLGAAYPNPFNPTTTLELAIPEAGYVSVKVYNLVGQEVATLVDGVMDATPSYTFQWNAGSLSSGVYLVRAEGAGQVTTQKLMLLK